MGLARAQHAAGNPSHFVPQCDYGIFITSYGLPETDPSDRALRELIALEGTEPEPPMEAFAADQPSGRR